MAEWYSLSTPAETARYVSAWGGIDAPTDELGGFLLEIAREQVIAYAEADSFGWPSDGGDYIALPSRYVYAQLQQAKNLWNAAQVSSNGDAGTDTYSYTPRPLDKTIRQIIRPTSGVPNGF